MAPARVRPFCSASPRPGWCAQLDGHNEVAAIAAAQFKHLDDSTLPAYAERRPGWQGQARASGKLVGNLVERWELSPAIHSRDKGGTGIVIRTGSRTKHHTVLHPDA